MLAAMRAASSPRNQASERARYRSGPLVAPTPCVGTARSSARAAQAARQTLVAIDAPVAFTVIPSGLQVVAEPSIVRARLDRERTDSARRLTPGQTLPLESLESSSGACLRQRQRWSM